MMRILPWLAALGGFPGLGCDGSPAASPDEPPTRSGPVWHCAEPVADLGRVWSGDVRRHRYQISNPGTEPLEILRVDTNCGCATSDDFDRVIQPGATGQLPLVVNTLGMAAQDLSKTVTVWTNDPRQAMVALSLKGRVEERVRLDPRSGAVFGQVMPGEAVEKEIRITNHIKRDIEVAIRPGNPGDRFLPTLEVVQPGREFLLRVRFEAPAQGGAFRQLIHLDTDVATDRTVLVHCSALVPRPVEVVPATLVVRESETEESRYAVTLYGRGETPLVVTSADAGDPEVKVSFRPEPGENRTRVELVFPAGYRLPVGGLRLDIRVEDDKLGSLSVPIRPWPRPKGASNG